MRAMNTRSQQGASTIPVLFGIIVFGFLLQGLSLQINEREEQIVADGVSATIYELVKAQARHISDPANPNFGTYAATPEQLVATGYLPAWRSNADYSFTFPATGLQVNYVATDTAEAAEIAIRFGQLGSVTDSTVTASFADPMDLSLFDVYVEVAGDTMTGPLEFEARSGANVDLNQNAIIDVSSLTATNPAATGLVETNVVTADTAIFQDLRIAE